MAIAINPNIPSTAAPSAPAAAAGLVLQVGQVISAQVVQVLGNDQVQIAIGSQTIEAATQVPLQAGQTLQLQVSQTANGIGLAIVNSSGTASSQGAPGTTGASNAVVLAPALAASIAANVTAGAVTPANPLTPVETLAVTLAAESAASQQTSLASLFADLAAAAALPNLPPQVLQAAAQVLAQQINLDQNLTGETIKQAFQSSGLFLETTLASGAVPSSNGVPDLKAALIVLRQALTASLAGASAAETPAATSASPAQPNVISAPPSQGTAPAEVQAGITLPEITPSDPTATGPISIAASTTATSQATASAAPAVPSALETLATPVTILADVATAPILESVFESPSIVPQPQTGNAAATVSPPPSPAPAIASDILALAAGNQALTPAAATADAAARAALSSAALNLLQEALQSSPLATANLSRFIFENGQALSLLPAIAGARVAPAIEDPEFARANLPPPPISGALPSAQAVAPVTLPAHVPVEATLQHLLSDTDGAIARQTLLQIASLPGQTDPSATKVDPSIQRWNFEIPFATPQGTAIAQFEISRDGGGREIEAAKAVWRARFSLNVEPAGPVHALISLVGDRISVRMWAERPATASQLRVGISQLSQALSRAELLPGDILVRDGAPVPPAPASAGHFLDRAS
ncbi:MAG TPA: flagellar hook-length control protein FliK [Bradyrhizobium sp.]|nr:flagellar hook-length control protein FliK [Bradyrhizobium sp.]